MIPLKYVRLNNLHSIYLYILELGAVCYLSHSRDVKHNRLKENILHSGGLWETLTKAPRKREGPSGAITTECYQPQTLGS